MGAVLSVAVCAAPVYARDVQPAPRPLTQGGELPPMTDAPDFDSRLTGALLADADLPADLHYDPRASGPLATPGFNGELVTYVRREPGAPRDNAALLDQPAGTVILVKNSVQVLGPEALTPDALDTAIGGTEAATSAGGGLVDSTTRYPGLAIGDESRALSLRYQLQGAPVASTAIVFRRGPVVAALNVVATGEDPPFEQAWHLAEIVDGRLARLIAVPWPLPPRSMR
jgi:hypothetical protein